MVNEVLLQDEKVVDMVKKEIEQYFLTNDTKEISEATLWEAHKAYIRCILISICAEKIKREQKI